MTQISQIGRSCNTSDGTMGRTVLEDLVEKKELIIKLSVQRRINLCATVKRFNVPQIAGIAGSNTTVEYSLLT